MRIIGNDPSVPRQTQEVASGTLPNGKPVVVNADGTGTVFDSNVNKIVNFYRYGGDDRVGGVVFTNASTDRNLTSENYIYKNSLSYL